MRYFLRKPLHTSWLIATASVMVVIGAWASGYLAGWFVSISWLLTGLALCLAAMWYQRAVWIVAAIVGGLLIGLWRGSIEGASQQLYQHVIGQTHNVSGVVSEDVDIDKRSNLVLRLKDVSIAGRQMSGSAWVTVASGGGLIQRSDRVTVNAKINEGFGTYPIALYRADIVKIERPEPGDVALEVRDRFAEAVRENVPDPEASLGIGYLVGQRRALPPELDEALRVAGLTHIVVASGYNLTILVRIMRRLFEKVSKYLSMITSAGLIISFIAVTGMSPSMSRAGLVAGLALAAWCYGRKFHPLVLLPFAAAITVLVNPSYVWGDIGWQLSFAAFAGVMILAPLAQAYFFGDKKLGLIRQILGETIAATICTLPILLVTFGELSNVAILANLLVLPLVPLAMLLTFIAGVGGFLFGSVAWLLGLPATWLLQYMVWVAGGLADLPWALTEIGVQMWQGVVLACGIIGVCVYMWRVTKLNLRDSSIID